MMPVIGGFGMLVVLLLIVIWAGVAIWRAATGWQFRRDRAVCAKCDYPVEGLGSWICPECGSHLLQVGILGWQQDLKKRNWAVEGIAGWCVIASFISLFLAYPWIDQAADYSGVLLVAIWIGLSGAGAAGIFLLRRRAIRRKRAREAEMLVQRTTPPRDNALQREAHP